MLEKYYSCHDFVCNCLSHGYRCSSFPVSACNESSIEQSRKLHVISDSSSTNNTDVLNNYASLESLKDGVDLLWHNRLGHVPFVKMRNIPTIPIKFSTKQPFICTICPMARQVRLPFTPSTTHSKNIFELLHIDLWSPYHVPTYDNYKYFITLVDDYSRATWTYLLSTKSNAIQVLQTFVNMIENQFQTTIKCIGSDNGLEFNNNETLKFFQAKGITHQKSCPIHHNKTA